MTGHTLFLGNSINQLGEVQVSWGDVMKQVVAEVKPKSEMTRLRDMPFPFAFDGITLAAGVRQQDDESWEEVSRTEIKKIVATSTLGLTPNPFHHKVVELGCPHIITTNYDYTFELAAADVKGPVPKENLHTLIGTDETQHGTKYSLFRRRFAADRVRVWHMHGEALNERSIMLGHEHYAGALERMRKYVKSNDNYHGLKSRFRLPGPNYNEAVDHCSWLDVFFRDHVHIAGFGLDYSEVDIWWALYYKERLRNSGSEVGETHYYPFDGCHPAHSPMGRAYLAKNDLLKSLRVHVHPVAVKKKQKGATDWKMSWDDLLAQLKNELAR